MTARKKAQSTGPHKILTLDGGGIRGAMSIEILAKIESIAHNKGYETLADYFDYIAGTSTGGIIATGLSLGWSVEKLRKFYEEHAEAMFDKAFLLKLLRYKYDDENLRKILKKEIGNTKLGSNSLKTLLMLVMRNATTDSPWPVSNNPFAKYNDRKRKHRNTDIPLWQLVRASTAAPTFFPPECVNVGDKEFIFVDGGVTCYNNPSFQTFLMATSEPYRLNWQTGEDQLLLVSIGTGSSPVANEGLLPGDMNLLYNATTIPSALMFAASNEQDLLCRMFGNCLEGDPIDREVGDMCAGKGSLSNGPNNSRLFTYMRYNAELTEKGLGDLGVKKLDAKRMQAMDRADNLPGLQAIGKAVAKKRVLEKHFSGF
ncbi:MAG: patatin-like phospholipase family protein [Granulosicoccus sp.]